MAYSTQVAVSDGTLSVLPLSIDYLSRDDITVYLGSAQAAKDVVWAWVGTTDRSIQFTPAVPKDVVVTVKRSTGVTGLYHKFSGGAQFTSKTLDESLTQTLFVAQEFSESSSVASDDLPLPVGSQASAGKSNKYARTDHVHVGMTGGAVGSVVMDTFTGDGVKLAFTLQNTPTSKGSTQVFIDSVYQSKQVYALAGHTITFDEAPAVGAVIEVITVTIGGGKASDIQLAETPEMLATDTGGNLQGALQWVAGLLRFMQGGAGAVVRKLKDKLKENVSVFDFMTATQIADVQAGTKAVDVTAALQAALDYLTTVGGTLVFPQGQYKTTAMLVLGADDVRLMAHPKAVLWPTNCHGIQIGNPHSPTYTSGRRNNITVENLQINMTNAGAYNGINVYNTDEYKASNVSVFYGSKGTYMFYVYNASLYDCVNIMGTTCGLELDGCCDKTTIIRGQYGNTGQGIVIRGGKAITIQGVSSERNQKEAIIAYAGIREGGSPEWPDAINIRGCYIERNCQASGEGAVSLGSGPNTTGDYSKGHVISGNYFNHDAGNPRAAALVPILYMGKVSEVRVQANRYVNTSNYIALSADAYKGRLWLDDLAGEKVAITTMRCEIPVQMAPVQFDVPCDANGTGTYTLDVTSYYSFVSSWLVACPSVIQAPGTMLVRSSDGTTTASVPLPAATVHVSKVNATKYTIKVWYGPANGNLNVTALIMGKFM